MCHTLYMFLIYTFLGAVLGSFAGALTYRWPHGESILQGRSQCPKCKHQIAWFDNIPLLSYLILRGKCRNCSKPISIRYFYIELGLTSLFTLFYFAGLATPLNLAIIFITYCIFIIDFEHQYIPDTLSFVGLLLVISNLFFLNQSPYLALASGLSAGVFLLLINLLTLGRGMGLGDVKLALFLGSFLSFPLAITWMFMSFVIGSVIGLILIIFRLKKFKQRIAFGPFLVAGFYIVMLFGETLTDRIFPYLWF